MTGDPGAVGGVVGGRDHDALDVGEGTLAPSVGITGEAADALAAQAHVACIGSDGAVPAYCSGEPPGRLTADVARLAVGQKPDVSPRRAGGRQPFRRLPSDDFGGICLAGVAIAVSFRFRGASTFASLNDRRNRHWCASEHGRVPFAATNTLGPRLSRASPAERSAYSRSLRPSERRLDLLKIAGLASGGRAAVQSLTIRCALSARAP